MIVAALVMLALAGVCFFGRLVLGPRLADRVVALDGLVITLISAIALDAARRDSALFVDAVVVIALVGFVGTAAASRFIEERGG
ncbi:MAG TPA: monovalent cation/H+ antiporter complex subunit F [Acidimicrobiales bacterium]